MWEIYEKMNILYLIKVLQCCENCVGLLIINDYSSKVFVKLKLLIILVNIVNIKMKSDGILMD